MINIHTMLYLLVYIHCTLFLLNMLQNVLHMQAILRATADRSPIKLSVLVNIER